MLLAPAEPAPKDPLGKHQLITGPNTPGVAPTRTRPAVVMRDLLHYRQTKAAAARGGSGRREGIAAIKAPNIRSKSVVVESRTVVAEFLQLPPLVRTQQAHLHQHRDPAVAAQRCPTG